MIANRAAPCHEHATGTAMPPPRRLTAMPRPHRLTAMPRPRRLTAIPRPAPRGGHAATAPAGGLRPLASLARRTYGLQTQLGVPDWRGPDTGAEDWCLATSGRRDEASGRRCEGVG